MKEKSLSISHPTNQIQGIVQLTGSKSESNRALIIQALSKGKVTIDNLSEAFDTVTLENELLKTAEFLSDSSRSLDSELTIDIGPAGTAMRFLTAYLSLQNGKFILTGSDRMKKRPIGILVDALRSMGAKIEYTEQKGYPPLSIQGPIEQEIPEVSIMGDVSSQYLSSILLIASSLPNGLLLKIEGELTSKPYLIMTLEMLKEVGIRYEWEFNNIRILPQEARETTLSIEPDWSAASYWYSLVALADQADIFLPGLMPSSIQGDSEIQEIMQSFGVLSIFTGKGLKLTKTPILKPQDHFDFKSCPDLAQTIIVCCAAMGREATFMGMETLKIKETDRIQALQNELAKFGVQLLEERPQVYRLDCSERFIPESISIKTYDDHRMAMAFAPLALKFKNIDIEEPSVVEKSYPRFWQHLKEQGFIISSPNP